MLHFAGKQINETLVNDLASGNFLAHERNVVLIGGNGKTHVAIAHAAIRHGARGRFSNVVDLVNELEAETRSGRQGRMADYLGRKEFVVLDQLPKVQDLSDRLLPSRQRKVPMSKGTQCL